MLTDEQLRQNELNRATNAEQVLKNPLVQEVLDSLEHEIITAWEATPMRDQEAREKAWMFYVTVRKFRNIFQSYIETGRMASLQLEAKRRSGIFKVFGGN